MHILLNLSYMFPCVIYRLQEEHHITCSKPSASYSIVVYITLVML